MATGAGVGAEAGMSSETTTAGVTGTTTSPAETSVDRDEATMTTMTTGEDPLHPLRCSER